MTPNSSSPTLGRARRWLRRWHEAAAASCVVVAVSGGSDSVGLLRLLAELAAELGLQLSVAHLHHGVRGEAADEDARFVAELAERLGLPFDLGSWAPQRRGHFEADARRARYAWLVEVARRRGARAVAVGHTRDDQAETILMRVLRGTGLRGLAGMPARRRLEDRVELIRPLLGMSREAVRAYLRELGQGWREDASNAVVERTRARIRQDLLPRLAAAYNPQVITALVRLGRLARASGRGWERLAAERERAAVLGIGPDELILDRRVLAAAEGLVRAEVFRRLWRRAGWPEGGMTAQRWRRLAALTRRSQGRFAVGGGIEMINAPDRLLLLRRTRPAEVPPVWPAVPLEVPGSAPWRWGRVVAVLAADAPREETIDGDCLVPPLIVRAPRTGDRFEPLGMAGRGMPLSDFLRGRKVPRGEREAVPLVCDQLGIVWVVGHRIAERVRRTERTRFELGLRWDADTAGPDRRIAPAGGGA